MIATSQLRVDGFPRNRPYTSAAAPGFACARQFEHRRTALARPKNGQAGAEHSRNAEVASGHAP
jgi:hypothetical protein